ncbi:hypothetical protein G3M48_004996 [Beauveria asiatica]|uniref:Myb/SANT-like domain-containing protein n=1 Tax=Beauveria asiatica TaxID=1069075 RepID=A0AAW0RRZ1_9HYPO
MSTDENSQTVTNLSWTSEETATLILGLLEAKRHGKLYADRASVMTPLLKGIIVRLQQKSPRKRWAIANLSHKYRDLWNLWRCFKKADSYTGRSKNNDTGEIKISDIYEQQLRDDPQYKEVANRVLTNGMPCGLGITLDTFEELFSKDRPAGKYIRSAFDSTDEEAQNSMSETDDSVAADPSTQLMEEPLFIDGENDQEPTFQGPCTPTLSGSPRASSPSTSRGASRGRQVLRPPLTLTKNRGVQKGKRRAVGTVTLAAVEGIFSHYELPRVIHLNHLPAGALELQRALQDCWKLEDEIGRGKCWKIANWLIKDPMRPFAWNVMPSKEHKLIMLERFQAD